MKKLDKDVLRVGWQWPYLESWPYEYRGEKPHPQVRRTKATPYKWIKTLPVGPARHRHEVLTATTSSGKLIII